MSNENAKQDGFSEDEINAVVLPEWLTNSLPQHLPLSTISFEGGRFHVSHDGSEFDEITEAYDYLRGFQDQYQAVLDESVDGHGGQFSNGFFFCEAEEGETSARLLLSHQTEEIVTGLKEDYIQFLTDTSMAYHADPENFVKAHDWLSRHPAFWTKADKEKSFHWDTDFGLKNMDINVWANEETGKTVVFLEHGLHVEPDYSSFYRDDRIFARAETYEQAIIQMAKNVDKTYDLDGNERQKD